MYNIFLILINEVYHIIIKDCKGLQTKKKIINRMYVIIDITIDKTVII